MIISEFEKTFMKKWFLLGTARREASAVRMGGGRAADKNTIKNKVNK